MRSGRSCSSRVLTAVVFLGCTAVMVMTAACVPVGQGDPGTGKSPEATAEPGPQIESDGDESVDRRTTENTTYVSVYSHIYHQGGRTLPLEVTLSIRNTDPRSSIVVRSVRYFDTSGALIKEYLDQALKLGPLASADYRVERRDMAGGVGAKILVDWAAPETASEPIIESVMVGSEGNKAFAFARAGQMIDRSGPDE